MQGGLRERAPAGLRLIETLRWEPATGAARCARHLARLDAGCAALGISRLPGEAEALLDAVTGPTALRLRLTVGLDGRAELTQAPLPAAKPLWRVAIAPARVNSASPWLRLKTTERALYDTARAALPEGVDELIFLNERGEIAEGTITNLFVACGDGLLTPPLAAGCLPGVLRAELLAEGRAREATLHPEDLREGLFLGNALRGLIPATLA